MANKTPKVVIRKPPQTAAEWQEIVRYLNKTVEGTELVAAMLAHKAEVDPHPVYLTEAEGDARYENAPIGTVILWPSQTPPENFMIADGSELSRAANQILFGVVGIVYGAGDGSTTFNIPNIQPIELA